MKRCFVMLLALCLVLSLSACGQTQAPSPTATPAPSASEVPAPAATPTPTPPQPDLDEEMAAILELGLCSAEDLEHLAEPIDALSFYDLLLDSLRLNQREPATASLARRDELGEYPIERMEAATWLFFVVLENYFGEDLSEDPWSFGAYEYARSLDSYAHRCGAGLAHMEHKRQTEGVEDAGWSWGTTFCAIQLDPYSLKPLMEVDEEGYFRSKDMLTREEALRAIYRSYRSYRFSQPLELDEIEPLLLSTEQQEKAKQMPAASYDALPDWKGNQLDNKTFSAWANNSSDMYRQEDFEILRDLGFNFTRLFITHELLYDLSEGVRIDSKHLDNLDQAIAYAIDNGIHISICLYDFPGFAGASMDDAGFYDADLLAQVSRAYAFLAKRYRQVPNSVLSFNLFNEPWRITKELESYYVDAVHAVSDVIWDYSPDRLIFVDGIAGSQEPVESLAGEPYAQAFHMYGPEQFVYSNWVGRTTWYQGQQWPLPYANGMLNGDRTLTLQGSFPVGTQIDLLLVGDCSGELMLMADGADVASLPITWGEIGDGKTATLCALTTPAKELLLRWVGEGSVQFQSLAVIYPETSEQGTPLVSSPWAAEENIRRELIQRKMTVIYCDAWCLDGDQASTLVLNEDGTYTNPGQAALCYDQEYLRRWLDPWLNFREESGTEIMLQEWGIVEIVSDDGGRAYLSDWAELLSRYEIPWNKWGSFLNTKQLDVDYEDYRGFLLNRGMIDALMTKTAASSAP